MCYHCNPMTPGLRIAYMQMLCKRWCTVQDNDSQEKYLLRQKCPNIISFSCVLISLSPYLKKKKKKLALKSLLAYSLNRRQ